MRRREQGATILEVILALAFLAITLVPISNMLLSSYETTTTKGNYDEAFTLAQELLEEIGSKLFEEPPFGSGTFGAEELFRIDFDDIDDYNNYGPNSPPLDISSAALVDFSGYTRSASVVNLIDIGLGSTPRTDFISQINGSTGFKLVTVTVTWDGGTQKETLERIYARTE
ncbi:MAG: hypothetical protein OEM38_05170 [Gammaproteobacteria bacterium]|nr:hypothetical protein [Gammaproteobacteria bacterium]